METANLKISEPFFETLSWAITCTNATEIDSKFVENAPANYYSEYYETQNENFLK
jgi:hypothetical protein